MLWDNPASNIGLALWYLNSIDILYTQNAQAVLDAKVSDLRVQNWTSAYYPGTNDFPAFYVGSNGAYSLFVGGGTQNAVQGVALLNGYTDSAPQPQFGDANDYLKTCVNLIIGLPIPQFLTADVCVFGGHSLGGALATVLGLVAYNQVGRDTIKVTSFGSPRPGGSRFVQRTRGLDIARWMNTDDPVPLCPPTVEQAPLQSVVTPTARLMVYANQRHVEGGLQLDPQGVLSSAEIPRDAAVTPSTSLATWLLSLTNGQFSPHNTSAYADRLVLYQNAVPVASTHAVQGAPPEVMPPVRRAEVVAEVQKARSSLIRSGAVQAAGPVIIPKRRAFEKVRFGSVWYVTLGGTPIAVGPRRNKAGQLAVAGNDMLRKLQRESYVDPVAFATAFTAYLAAASDPTSGIRPTLPVGPV